MNFFGHKRSRTYWGWWITGIILVFLLVTVWPMRPFFRWSFLTQTNLVLLTNEAEARPCGGFVTAFGTFRVFPPKFQLKNSYDFESTSFGPAEGVLAKVSAEKKFWDLGTSPDLSRCASDFRVAYETARKEKISHVVMLNIGTIEQLVGDPDFFARMTRTVADVDRHDEKSLAERKTPLADFGKKLIWKWVVRPWTWPSLVQTLARNFDEGNLFVSEISPEIRPEVGDFAVTEWNLGGAKSSRFLKKYYQLSLRETAPDQWKIRVKFSAEHLGGFDEPLSQDWKGGFEFKLPEFLGGESRFFEASLAPGETFEKSFEFPFTGKLNTFGIFRPRGQDALYDVRVSLFPQKTFRSATFTTHENVGEFAGEISGFRKDFTWTENADETSPFVTLHEVVGMDHLSDVAKQKWGKNFTISSRRFGVAEIHFNEPVKIQEGFTAKISDKNFKNPDISSDPEVDDFILLPDQRTLLLGFWETNVQPGERYLLKMYGVQDIWGNQMVDQGHTLVDGK